MKGKKRPGDEPRATARRRAGGPKSGISNRPVEREVALQSSLPPRGAKRGDLAARRKRGRH